MIEKMLCAIGLHDAELTAVDSAGHEFMCRRKGCLWHERVDLELADYTATEPGEGMTLEISKAPDGSLAFLEYPTPSENSGND